MLKSTYSCRKGVVWLSSVRWQHSGPPPPPVLFIPRIGVVWPTLVMRTRVTVWLESRGNAARNRVPGSLLNHTGLPHSQCLLRLQSDCKSQALLTHLCCLSPRLMAITSVCSPSEGGEDYKNLMFFRKKKKKPGKVKTPTADGEPTAFRRRWSFSPARPGDDMWAGRLLKETLTVVCVCASHRSLFTRVAHVGCFWSVPNGDILFNYVTFHSHKLLQSTLEHVVYVKSLRTYTVYW